MVRDPPPRMSQVQRRESLADPNYKGQDYAIDTAVENGPLIDRRCTDILCILIFLGFVAAATFVGIYAVENGDPMRIMTPYDVNGNFCGKKNTSIDLTGYPYLWYQDIGTPFWLAYATCVTECPT